MTCNLGSEKMPIILDQPETDSIPANQGVFQTIQLNSEEHNTNAQTFENDLSSKTNYKDKNIVINDVLKSDCVKTCLGAKKIPEDLKKYSSNLATPPFVYCANELLSFNNSESLQQKEIPISLKIEHKKYKKKIKEKDGSDFAETLKGQNNSAVECIFGARNFKETCYESKKKSKINEKLIMSGKCYKLIAPHPDACERQESITVEKQIQKLPSYGLNHHISTSETMKEYGEEQVKSSDERDKCIQDYSNYGYSEKSQNDTYVQSNLLSDFENYNKESKVNDIKNKKRYVTKVKCYKCFNCSFMSLNFNYLNFHTQKKDKCFHNNETFHCPGCKNVFYSLTPLRVHLVHDHKMLQREVKLILQNIQEITFETEKEKSSCAYESQNEVIQNGNLYNGNVNCADMSIQNIGDREGIIKSGFVQMQTERNVPGGRELESCLNTKRQTMLESYLDDISNKTDCGLPATLTQNGSDLLENTFNFTAPVSEQLPSIQPPPAHSSSNSLIEHPHLIMNQQENHGFVGMANVFPEHRVEEQFKGNGENHFEGESSLIMSNGNYLPQQMHDIPVINLDDNHLVKPTENILPQDINMDDFPAYHEVPNLDEEESGCRLSVEDDDDQEEKKKLRKLGVGFRCDINGCKVRLQSEKNIQYHRRCHEGTLYNCPECCKDCSTWVSLSSHLWQAHKIDMELYKCDQCPYKTPSYSRLTNIHRGIHGKARPFLCDVCGKGFKTVKQMRNHKNIHKAKMVRMSVCHCDICGRTVADKRQLELHINNTHKKKKPYLCYMCGYASAVKHSLVVHMRRHTGEKPYECEKCDYKTADHNALRRHKMKHSGVRNYKCSHCSYTCIQASTYKVHIKTKHPGLETDVIFGCGQCSFQTLNRGSFLSHTSEHENYNNHIRKQTKSHPQPSKEQTESGNEYYGENNRVDLVGPIISERVVETIRDLSGAQTLLEDDYYERITGDLENAHEMKFKTSGIT